MIDFLSGGLLVIVTGVVYMCLVVRIRRLGRTQMTISYRRRLQEAIARVEHAAMLLSLEGARYPKESRERVQLARLDLECILGEAHDC